MAQQIEKVGVLGAGLMGHGIAQVAAQSGYEVVAARGRRGDAGQGHRARSRSSSRARSRRASPARRTPTRCARASRGTTHYRELADCDLVIEAITESLPLKLEMWREVDEIVKPEAIFATNTSSLAVIDQAAATGRPERFVGLHYFNPAQVMKLVEVVRCVTTDDEAFDAALEFARSEGKLAIPTKDKAGFIVNRLLVPYMLDAMRALRRGRRLDRGDRRGDEGRRRAPDGPADARRLRRPGHARLDLRRAVRRVPRAPLRAPADAAQDAQRRLVRAQVGQGLLRLLGRGAAAERGAVSGAMIARHNLADMSDPSTLRVADADRERLAGELREHMVAGRLTRRSSRSAWTSPTRPRRRPTSTRCAPTCR